MAQELIRSIRDSSEGCVYDVYYDTNTGRYSQCRRGREDEEEQDIDESSWHVQGMIRQKMSRKRVWEKLPVRTQAELQRAIRSLRRCKKTMSKDEIEGEEWALELSWACNNGYI